MKTHSEGYHQREYAVLRTAVYTDILVASGSLVEYYCSMNGCFNPSPSYSFAPIAGYAKWMAVYTKCYVRAAKITMICTNQYAVAAPGLALAPTLCGLTLSTATGALGSATALMMPGLTNFKVLYNNPDTCTLVMSVDVKKFMGVDDLMDGTQFYSTVAANPTQGVFCKTWFQNQASAYAQNTNVAVTITIDYDVVFTDPVPVT